MKFVNFLSFLRKKKSPGENCVKRVCQVLVQKLSRNTCKRIDTFTGHPSRIIPPPSLSFAKSLETVVLWRKCLSHVLAIFGTLPLALHTWTAAPSKQQTAPVPCIAAIHTQITLHNLEQARILYFMVPCLLAPATFKGQRNVRIRCTACRKIRIDTLVDVCESELLYRKKKWTYKETIKKACKYYRNKYILQ